MTPNVKKLLSALAVAAVGAVLPILTKAGSDAVPALAVVISSASLALAHYVSAWGTKEGVVKSVLDGNEAPTIDKIVADQLSKTEK